MLTSRTKLRRSRTWRWLVVSALSATALACTGNGTGGSSSGVTDPGNSVPLGQAEAGLVAVQSCGELEGYVKAVAVAEMKKGSLYYSGGGGVAPTPAVDMAFDANGEEAPSAGSDGGTQNDGGQGGTPKYSETNNQVAGVDEADLVKTDGNFIYTVQDGVLRIVKTLPAAESELVSELTVGTYPSELFLEGDTVVLYGQTWGNKDYGTGDWIEGVPGIATSGGSGGSAPPSTGSTDGNSTDPDDAPPMAGGGSDPEPAADTPASKPGGPNLDDVREELRGQVLVMTFVDVSDRANPVVTRTFAMEGSYAAARRIGTSVYTVTRSNLFLPGIYAYGYGYGGGVAVDVAVGAPAETDAGGASTPETDSATDLPASDSGKADTAPEADNETTVPSMEDIEAAYLAALDAQSIDDWMPKVVEITAAGKTVSTLGTCGDFYKPTVQQGLQTVSVVAFDLSDGAAAPQVTTTIGQVGRVFASADAIYAASYVYDYWYWGDEAEKNEGEYSLVHKFDIAGGALQYSASGKVPGDILNQFSMDEHNGYLRVATTERNWSTEAASSNGVYVLGQDGGALNVVGKVDGLAEGEQIYSARFVGDKGYVVTFETVDPLFTLDLSDPTAPAVVGELKIPGFSTYIHPLGDNHLLTIGQDTLDNGEWVQIQGMQLQIFDVTDPANPALAHKETFSGGEYSEALYEHKAFNYFADAGLLAIPFENYGGTGVDGGVPEETGTDDGTDEEPNVPAQPTYDAGVKVFAIDAAAGISLHGTISHVGLTQDDTWNYWRTQVRRTLMIEGNLYSLGTAGMLVNAASDLTELAKVIFPYADGGDKLIDGGEEVPVPGEGPDSGDNATDPVPTPAS